MKTKSDLKGMNVFYQFLLKRGKSKKIEFTKDIYDKVDVIVDDSTIELKYRKGYKFNSPLIRKEGILVEKDKADYALRTITESGYTNSYYVSIFADNVIAILDFNEVKNCELTTRKCPHQTEFNDNEKISKKVYIIPIDRLKIFSY